MRLFQVDAFTRQKFKGNPAGVCILDKNLTDREMQFIASEMNLSETAFIKMDDDYCDLRWFTPLVEVDLCGHATLASAYVLYDRNYFEKGDPIRFRTKSGILEANYVDGMIQMEFPLYKAKPAKISKTLQACFDPEVVEVSQANHNILVELASDDAVKNASPDIQMIRENSEEGVIITARSGEEGYDFVSRYFAPNVGIDEDPVTGSNHSILAPYWEKRLGKNYLVAYQASQRGGILYLKIKNNKVLISGDAVIVFETELAI